MAARPLDLEVLHRGPPRRHRPGSIDPDNPDALSKRLKAG